MSKQWTPKDVAPFDDVMTLMPAYRDLPDEFRNGRSPYNDLVSTWFFKGLNKSALSPKPGIDANKAFRCLSVILQDWTPSHEHKTAGVAYLMSLWFDIAEPQKGKKGK
jgi:hypothetical protein